jgi:hypothetical protein
MKTVGISNKKPKPRPAPLPPGATPIPATPVATPQAGQPISQENKEKLNRLLQEIAWETVTHHPMTGVK